MPWLESIIAKYAERLCRFKGVLCAVGAPVRESHKLVLQGVFGHVELTDGGVWGVNKGSRIVFIGRVAGIADELREGVERCFSTLPPSSGRRRRVVPQMTRGYQNSTR
eukprot:TRINITY_DN16686_c0_g1_i1.p1 TRINITY_DN16686_c0_g1~~TRINITY_DN16686_c0_g1_i1.p1  ORF type:complete len:108 (-),score=17.34 TRINITY_DN16686_c0_g1_i1:294-617(-)